MGQSFKKWARATWWAGWVAWAGGCAEPASTTRPAMPAPAISAPAPVPPPQSLSTADQRFVLAPELERSLQVVSVGLTPGAFLKIQVNVQNKTDAPVRFRYRIEWFDKDGALLPLAGEKFMPWMLLPHETSLIAATALAASAVDFEIAFVPDAK